jgi:hypothetical protein
MLVFYAGNIFTKKVWLTLDLLGFLSSNAYVVAVASSWVLALSTLL